MEDLTIILVVITILASTLLIIFYFEQRQNRLQKAKLMSDLVVAGEEIKRLNEILTTKEKIIATE